MKYYKIRWNRSVSEIQNNNPHLFYYEVGNDNYPSRSIEIFDDGKIVRRTSDDTEFGEMPNLANINGDLQKIFEGTEITKEEYDSEWENYDH